MSRRERSIDSAYRASGISYISARRSRLGRLGRFGSPHGYRRFPSFWPGFPRWRLAIRNRNSLQLRRRRRRRSIPADGQSSPSNDGLRYTGYVLNQAIACGCPHRSSGKTLGAVTRQAGPTGGSPSPTIGEVVENVLEAAGSSLKN